MEQARTLSPEVANALDAEVRAAALKGGGNVNYQALMDRPPVYEQDLAAQLKEFAMSPAERAEMAREGEAASAANMAAFAKAAQGFTRRVDRYASQALANVPALGPITTWDPQNPLAWAGVGPVEQSILPDYSSRLKLSPPSGPMLVPYDPNALAMAEVRDLENRRQFQTSVGLAAAGPVFGGYASGAKVLGAPNDVVENIALAQSGFVGSLVPAIALEGQAIGVGPRVMGEGFGRNPDQVSPVFGRTIPAGRASLNGEPEVAPRNANKDMLRAIERQNQSGEILANHGVNVEYLPNTGVKGGNPDLLVNGNFADVYAPTSKNPNTIRDTIEYKVGHQGQTIVLNLSDSPLKSEKILQSIQSRPVNGLNELYVIKGRQVTYRKW